MPIPKGFFQTLDYKEFNSGILIIRMFCVFTLEDKSTRRTRLTSSFFAQSHVKYYAWVAQNKKKNDALLMDVTEPFL